MIDISTSRIPYNAVPQLSKTDRDYASDPSLFSRWIDHQPDLASFAGAIRNRQDSDVDRKLLVEVLKDQYARLGQNTEHLDVLLQKDQFTVTTAHQPALLTGPLYFIYKICSAINLAGKLNEHYPDYGFHPVLIIGGEDHDFEEINHVCLFGRTYSWETGQSGAVGRMHTQELTPLLDEIKTVLGDSPHATQLSGLIDRAFSEGLTYGQSMQKLVMQLFDHTPLIVVQMDDARLKSAFTEVARAELFKRPSHALIAESQTELENAGYKPQAYLREINLFYLHDQLRSRIEWNDNSGLFNIVDSSISFTPDTMEQELTQHPERFSPNVNLRPVYQEIVLPNLAYIGGGGEIAYWLERKTQFEHYNVPYPMLIRRNSVLYINRGMKKLRERLGFELGELFSTVDENIARWIGVNAVNEIDIQDETNAIAATLDALRDKAKQIDASLANKVEAFKAKTLKEVDQLGKRLVRAEKAQHEGSLQKIRKLHDKLFPGAGLQERHDNFMQFYLTHGQAYIDQLIDELDPLLPGFIVMEESA